MEKKVFRFSIKTNNETEIFGRNNRIAIQKFAKESKINGTVRNLKGKAEIEIFIVAESLDEVLILCEKINNETQINGQLTTISEATWCKVEDFKDFELIREDELTEMVWALQGAGREFSQTTNKLEKIQQNLEERDGKRRLARLSSLHLELGNLKKKIELLKNSRNTFETRKLQYVALEQSIRDPVDGDDEFIQSIHGVYAMVNDIEELDGRAGILGLDDKILDKIEPTITIIDETISNISKMMEGKDLSKLKK